MTAEIVGLYCDPWILAETLPAAGCPLVRTEVPARPVRQRTANVRPCSSPVQLSREMVQGRKLTATVSRGHDMLTSSGASFPPAKRTTLTQPPRTSRSMIGTSGETVGPSFPSGAVQPKGYTRSWVAVGVERTVGWVYSFRTIRSFVVLARGHQDRRR